MTAFRFYHSLLSERDNTRKFSFRVLSNNRFATISSTSRPSSQTSLKNFKRRISNISHGLHPAPTPKSALLFTPTTTQPATSHSQNPATVATVTIATHRSLGDATSDYLNRNASFNPAYPDVLRLRLTPDASMKP